MYGAGLYTKKKHICVENNQMELDGTQKTYLCVENNLMELDGTQETYLYRNQPDGAGWGWYNFVSKSCQS